MNLGIFELLFMLVFFVAIISIVLIVRAVSRPADARQAYHPYGQRRTGRWFLIVLCVMAVAMFAWYRKSMRIPVTPVTFVRNSAEIEVWPESDWSRSAIQSPSPPIPPAGPERPPATDGPTDHLIDGGVEWLGEVEATHSADVYDSDVAAGYQLGTMAMRRLAAAWDRSPKRIHVAVVPTSTGEPEKLAAAVRQGITAVAEQFLLSKEHGIQFVGEVTGQVEADWRIVVREVDPAEPSNHAHDTTAGNAPPDPTVGHAPHDITAGHAPPDKNAYQAKAPALPGQQSNPASIGADGGLTALQASIESPGAEPFLLPHVQFVDKPWVRSWNPFRNRFPQQNLWQVRGTTTEDAVQAATQLVLSQIEPLVRGRLGRLGARNLADTSRDLVRQELESGALIRDRFTQTFRIESAGPSTPAYSRTALLVDLSPDGLDPLIDRVTHREITASRRRANSWGTLGALCLLICLVYAGLNAATQGYYTWVLRAGAVAMVVALLLLLIV